MSESQNVTKAIASWRKAAQALIAHRKANGPEVPPQWGCDAAKLLELADELLPREPESVSTGWDSQSSFRVGG